MSEPRELTKEELADAFIKGNHGLIDDHIAALERKIERKDAQIWDLRGRLIGIKMCAIDAVYTIDASMQAEEEK